MSGSKEYALCKRFMAVRLPAVKEPPKVETPPPTVSLGEAESILAGLADNDHGVRETSVDPFAHTPPTRKVAAATLSIFAPKPSGGNDDRSREPAPTVAKSAAAQHVEKPSPFASPSPPPFSLPLFQPKSKQVHSNDGRRPCTKEELEDAGRLLAEIEQMDREAAEKEKAANNPVMSYQEPAVEQVATIAPPTCAIFAPTPVPQQQPQAAGTVPPPAPLPLASKPMPVLTQEGYKPGFPPRESNVLPVTSAKDTSCTVAELLAAVGDSIKVLRDNAMVDTDQFGYGFASPKVAVTSCIVRAMTVGEMDKLLHRVLSMADRQEARTEQLFLGRGGTDRAWVSLACKLATNEFAFTMADHTQKRPALSHAAAEAFYGEPLPDRFPCHGIPGISCNNPQGACVMKSVDWCPYYEALEEGYKCKCKLSGYCEDCFASVMATKRGEKMMQGALDTCLVMCEDCGRYFCVACVRFFMPSAYRVGTTATAIGTPTSGRAENECAPTAAAATVYPAAAASREGADGRQPQKQGKRRRTTPQQPPPPSNTGGGNGTCRYLGAQV